LLRQMQTTVRSALHDLDPSPAWSRGSLMLLGDAAHAMVPHLGQGANQSIEDGMALATILANASRETIPGALPRAGLFSCRSMRRTCRRQNTAVDKPRRRQPISESGADMKKAA
jgi:2-polyprenyl-6-methoxyphenol hydroxylase-like FAD-dependent oxidoreductase